MAKKKSAARRPCPCRSGLAYRECCRPFHRGEEAPDPARLMRSRFSAFALGDGEYLFRTLHPAHPLRGRDEAAVIRELSKAKDSVRYMDLTIHDADEEADRGRVLFTARVFEKGQDRSFVELSEFERADGSWRYREGLTVPRSSLDEEPSTIEAFLAAV
jgi:SEC-C motif-containing protein